MMLENIFAIMRRAYYLFAFMLAVPMTLVGLVGAIEYKGASDMVGWLVFGILVFPVAKLIHMTAHWIIWGKV
jgi:hypothetical protein